MNLFAPALAPAPAASSPSSVVKDLTTVLADTFALAVKTHGAHWNVRGAGFFRLHAAFEEQYQELYQAADELAERIRALGHDAPASLRQIADLSSHTDAPRTDDDALVRSLRDDHRRLADRLRGAIAAAQEGGDEATADVLISRAQSHDKTAWMLTATLGE
jgi:starvation-inducible DNA-binding protein